MNKEVANYTYASDLGGLPVLNAHFQNQRFARHVHEGYCIGVIDKGAQKFFRSGANHIASEHCIILVNPDQVHDGQCASDNGWSYSAIYPLPQLLSSVENEFINPKLGSPLFKEPVVSDRLLAKRLRYLNQLLVHSDNAMERESQFYSVMSLLFSRHAQQNYQLPKLLKAPQAVAMVRDFIDAHFAENVSTSDLAQLVGLNPYYLTRLFQETYGLPPHAYQIQKRLMQARDLIIQGISLLDVAMLCGFSDQSHLNRHFKKWLGATPGQFKRMVMN